MELTYEPSNIVALKTFEDFKTSGYNLFFDKDTYVV